MSVLLVYFSRGPVLSYFNGLFNSDGLSGALNENFYQGMYVLFPFLFTFLCRVARYKEYGELKN